MSEFRVFVAGSDCIDVREASDALSQAYDVLHAAGLVTEKRLELCLATERSGRDPVAFAHHLVSLCSTVNERS